MFCFGPLQLTYEFVKGSEKTINNLYEKIKEKIKDLRDCFEKEVTVDYDDVELAWLLFVDGCAILQYIYCAANGLCTILRLLKWLMSWSENEDELKNSIERYIQGQLIVPEDQHSMCCLNWISSILWKRSKQQ